MEARCTGSLTLDVVFSSPDNFRSEELIFDIASLRRGYHALLRRTAFTRFNAVLHYAYLKLKMPGPRGVITVSGNMERSLCTEEYTVALAVKHKIAYSSRTAHWSLRPQTQLYVFGAHPSAAAQINLSSISSYAPIDRPIKRYTQNSLDGFGGTLHTKGP